MMHLDTLVLYSTQGAERRIKFRAGKLNIVTGDSRTGKSSLINLIRFCLGSGNPHAPRGPIQDTVAWYGLVAHIGETSFFIGRPSPDADMETSAAMLLIGATEPARFDQLVTNTTSDAMRQYLAGLLGIEDNRSPATSGQTRSELSATFVHSLYYCFQGQGEIANPDILFHRQNREWQSQAIRDTMPYFLGAQGAADLWRRQELGERRRALRRAQQRLRAAQLEGEAGLGPAGPLLEEAKEAGLVDRQSGASDLVHARVLLVQALNVEPSIQFASTGEEFDRLNIERLGLAERVRELNRQLRGLEDFASVETDYTTELVEQRGRLASIGLVPLDSSDAICVLCGKPFTAHDAIDHQQVRTALEAADRHMELTARDTPRIESTRFELLSAIQATRRRLVEVTDALSSMANTEDQAVRSRLVFNRQSYVQGRIAQYLEVTELTDEADLIRLQQEVDRLSEVVTALEELVDPAAVRSRTISLLANVSKRLTRLAETLTLEHSEDGVRIDYDRLTIVADTPAGPAYMDRGEIGSAMNWVGYHLCAYLALQEFFIDQHRPVPSFVLLDQPSQAFFPRDRDVGGDLEELSDSDRENTRRLYRLMADTVEEAAGALQLIALDHADFEDEWFSDSVIERWRDGAALIPKDWIAAEPPNG